MCIKLFGDFVAIWTIFMSVEDKARFWTIFSKYFVLIVNKNISHYKQGTGFILCYSLSPICLLSKNVGL